MKKPLLLSILCLFVFVAPAAAQTWTSANGKFKIEAEFVQIKDDKVQLKRDDNGKLIWVKLKDLSKRDQTKANRLQKELDEAGKSKTKKTSRSRTSQLVEQVKLNCSVKISDVAQWNDDEKESGQPVVTLTATGPPAADAMQYGKLKIAKFIDGDGKTIKPEADEFSMNDITKELAKIDRDSDFFGVHPKDGVAIEIKIPAESPPERISELSGSFSLLTGGTRTTAEFDGLSKKIGKPLRSPSLKKAGLKIEMEDPFDEDQTSGLSFTVSGKLKMMSNIYVGDSNGNKFESQNGNSTSSFNKQANYSFFFSEDVTEEAVLYVELVEGAVEIKVPFEFTDLEVPDAE